MIGLSPLVGARTEDITDALKTTGVQLARQPLVAAKHVLGYAGKLVDVVAGNSDYTTAKRDRRFTDDSWQESGVYRRLLQAYLALDESCDEWVEDLDLDETGERKARFVMDLLTDSLAPTNNLLTNPFIAMDLIKLTNSQHIIRLKHVCAKAKTQPMRGSVCSHDLQ